MLNYLIYGCVVYQNLPRKNNLGKSIYSSNIAKVEKFKLLRGFIESYKLASICSF